jgi:aspartate/glutamate racemase
MTKLGVVAGMSDDDTANVTNQYLEIIKQTSDKVARRK